MRKIGALSRSAVFFAFAPGTVAGLVPWWITGWALKPAFFGLEAARFAGYALIALGLVPLVESFARFALKGLGTPAPIAPTANLVIGGFYRYMRNPMYAGVLAIIAGQAIIFADARLFAYAALVWVMFELFVLLYKEPALKRTYGGEYLRYRENVPRWIPRITPWRG